MILEKGHWNEVPPIELIMDEKRLSGIEEKEKE
jgi:hypothetical protein